MHGINDRGLGVMSTVVRDGKYVKPTLRRKRVLLFELYYYAFYNNKNHSAQSHFHPIQFLCYDVSA